MYYTYALLSLKSDRIYIGHTEDLKQRLIEHDTGIGGRYSSINRPFKLIFYEAFVAKKDAVLQEKFYKTGYGREVMKSKLKYTLEQCRVV